MRNCLKGENENGEIEFVYLDGNAIGVSILNGHATTYYVLEPEDVIELMNFLKFNNEQL